MLNDSVVLLCSVNTVLLEQFRSKRRYLMLEYFEREVIERFKGGNYITYYILHYQGTVKMNHLC